MKDMRNCVCEFINGQSSRYCYFHKDEQMVYDLNPDVEQKTSLVTNDLISKMKKWLAGET